MISVLLILGLSCFCVSLLPLIVPTSGPLPLLLTSLICAQGASTDDVEVNLVLLTLKKDTELVPWDFRKDPFPKCFDTVSKIIQCAPCFDDCKHSCPQSGEQRPGDQTVCGYFIRYFKAWIFCQIFRLPKITKKH